MITFVKCHNNVSIQDLGRPYAQHLGFSGSGAADEFSFLLANQLLGNNVNTPAFEILLGKVTLQFSKKCQLVITGADCDATLNEQPLVNNVAINVDEGDILNMNTPTDMLYSYISIKGGFSCSTWLKSASFTRNEQSIETGLVAVDESSSFALNNNDAAEQGAEKKYDADNHYGRTLNSHFHQTGCLILRYIPSHFWQATTKNFQDTFLNQQFKIAANSNKMGYRLSGRPLPTYSEERLSQPVAFGTIQLPNDGQPIVLMKDRQTIGGYPNLGVVMQIDLFRLSQKRPGEYVRFIPISYTQAQAQLLAFRSRFNYFS